MKDLQSSKLSVLVRAAKAYAQEDLSDYENNARVLYPDGYYPFVVSKDYPLPLHLFSPRLTALLIKDEDQMHTVDMWNLITARENIIRMITATEIKRTAAEALGKQFETIYQADTQEIQMKRKQMIGYMIKVVMECFGYMVYSSRMQVTTLREGADPEKRKTNFFKTATRYTMMKKFDVTILANKNEDMKIKAVFKSITGIILNEKTEYQKLYNLKGLSEWHSLQEGNRYAK